ncbi:MAG: arginase family protein [Solirubrobacteraceae bacterium]
MRARTGDGPTYLSFDIDVLDRAFTAGTGTPRGRRPLPARGDELPAGAPRDACTGFGVVEVSPAYDDPGQLTVLHAAAYEMLAVTRR